jgi:hypothetical protein
MNIDFSKNTDGLVPAIDQDWQKLKCFDVGLRAELTRKP